MAEELLAREHLARMAEEHLRERELAGGEVGRNVTDGEPARPQIERGPARLQNGLLQRP